MPTGNRERRGALRVLWSAPLHYRVTGPGEPPGELREGRLVDLSSSGALIAVPEQLANGSMLALQVANADPALRLTVLAVVVRQAATADRTSGEHCVGVEFRGLPARERADLAAFLLLQASRLGQLQHRRPV